MALEERVRALPQALDESLGEDGTTLSAGERARLALARIVVADRPWILLDEPTAHLDELTEQVIADTLVELARRGAVVVVAHRPALVALADHRLDLPAPGADQSGRRGHPSTARVERRRRLPVPDGSVDALPPARFAAEHGAGRPRFGVRRRADRHGRLADRPGVAHIRRSSPCWSPSSGVRAFGLARPALRYAERLRSHDVALRLLARRRVEVYDALVPLTPGRLGRRRGDLLASVVDDVDSVVDRRAAGADALALLRDRGRPGDRGGAGPPAAAGPWSPAGAAVGGSARGWSRRPAPRPPSAPP